VQALSNAEHTLRSDLRVAEAQAQTLRERAARRPRLVADLERLSAHLRAQTPVAEALSAARARRRHPDRPPQPRQRTAGNAA